MGHLGEAALVYRIGVSDILPARRFVGSLDDSDRPLRLPHFEVGDSGPCFLGEPLAGDVFATALLPLWNQCDGVRTVGSWNEADQEILRRWHRAGLIVGAPAVRPAGANLTVVSPHPDDAQLALGALLSTVGGRVLDVFTEETWTRRPYYQVRPELTAELLLAEERVTCDVLQTELTLLGHVDGAARPAWKDGFFVEAGDSVGVAEAIEAEPELFERLIADLGEALSGTGPVLTPLAVGGHVDHVYAREAVLALTRTGVMDPARVVFFEDMPYSLFADAIKAADSVAARAGLGTLAPAMVEATPAAADRKREALWTYRLQVAEGISGRVIRYGSTLSHAAFAERIWVPASSDGLLPVLPA